MCGYTHICQFPLISLSFYAYFVQDGTHYLNWIEQSIAVGKVCQGYNKETKDVLAAKILEENYCGCVVPSVLLVYPTDSQNERQVHSGSQEQLSNRSPLNPNTECFKYSSRINGSSLLSSLSYSKAESLIWLLITERSLEQHFLYIIKLQVQWCISWVLLAKVLPLGFTLDQQFPNPPGETYPASPWDGHVWSYRNMESLTKTFIATVTLSSVVELCSRISKIELTF